MPDSLCCSRDHEETTLHGFYYSEQVCIFWSHVGEWMAHIDPKQLLLLNIGYIRDNVDPPYWGKKCVVFLRTLAVTQMGIWMMRKNGLYDCANFSHYDLIFSLGISLESKSDAIKNAWTAYIQQKVGHMKGVNVGVILSSSSCALWWWSGSFGTPLPVSRVFWSIILSPNQLYDVCHWPHHLVISFQDLPLPQFFSSPQLSSSPHFFFWRSWTHVTVIHATDFLPCPFWLFFCPIKLRPAPHIGIVPLVFSPCEYQKTVSFPNHRQKESKVTKRGFILVIPMYSLEFFSPPHHNHFLYICF